MVSEKAILGRLDVDQRKLAVTLCDLLFAALAHGSEQLPDVRGETLLAAAALLHLRLRTALLAAIEEGAGQQGAGVRATVN